MIGGASYLELVMLYEPWSGMHIYTEKALTPPPLPPSLPNLGGREDQFLRRLFVWLMHLHLAVSWVRGSSISVPHATPWRPWIGLPLIIVEPMTAGLDTCLGRVRSWCDVDASRHGDSGTS